MMRLIIMRLLTRGPVIMSIFPFSENDNRFDKPVNPIIKPLIKDELGWDRVKRIFHLTEDGMLTKEFQSITNVTLSGIVFGIIMGGTNATRRTVDSFISNNEATKFVSHFDAKRNLQQVVSVNFIKQGAKMGGKLGFFCFLFSAITTCTNAYRGKLAMENYILGGSITGLLFRMNLGARAALVGTAFGSILGGVCGITSVLILHLSGTSIDEILDAQQKWATSGDEVMRRRIRDSVTAEAEAIEVKQLYEENMKSKLKERKRDVENCNV